MEWIEGGREDSDIKNSDIKNSDIKYGGGLFNLFKRDSRTNFSVTKINKVLCRVLSVVSVVVFLVCCGNLFLQIDLDFLCNLIDKLKGIIFGLVVVAISWFLFCRLTRGNKIDEDDKNYACFVM